MIVQLASLILAHSAAAVAPPMPPPGPEVAHAPQPHGTAASLFSVDDYPAKAVGTGAHGKVVARLTIDRSGRVAACSIVHSSGYSELDVATCNICDAARVTGQRSTATACPSWPRSTKRSPGSRLRKRRAQAGGYPSGEGV